MPLATISNQSLVATTKYYLTELGFTVQDATNPFTDDKVLAAGTRRFRHKSAAANTTSITATMAFVVAVPRSYEADGTLVFNFNSHVDVLPNTGQTIDIAVWVLDTNGVTTGSDLNGTAAQNLTATAANYQFVCTTPTLSPGQRLFVEVTIAVDDSGGSAGDKFGFLNEAYVTFTSRGGF